MEPPHFCYWKQGILSPTGHLYGSTFVFFVQIWIGEEEQDVILHPHGESGPVIPAVIPCFNIGAIRVYVIHLLVTSCFILRSLDLCS
ncbi:hypothetical protein Hdeb2414_s0007g00262781 [Helianthus debilis subsp. tardiflorus]